MYCTTLLLVSIAWVLTACAGAGYPPPAAASTSGAASAQRSTSPLTYVAIGASDAYGIGTGDPDRLNWPLLLTHDLTQPVHLVNLAIPGATVSEAMRAEVPVALAVHPAIVTIWLAANDLADGVDLPTYTHQLSALVTALTQGTRARIFIGNVPDLTLVPYFSSYDSSLLAAQVRAWNHAIAQVCRATGAHLVDLMAAWSDLGDHPEYISADGLHPSTLGAERIADTFAASIRATKAP